jgi:hypothetical protein
MMRYWERRTIIEIYGVSMHERGFECKLSGGDVPFFNDNCNGNDNDLIAVGINLGSKVLQRLFR